MYYELVYNSVAHPARLSAAALESILAGARKTNHELDVTGVLLYSHGEFVQLLEGPREAVRHIYYDIIYHDPRHRMAAVVWEQAIAQRGFAGWSMGFARPKDLDAARTPGLEGYRDLGVAGLDFSGAGSLGRQFLLSIYEQMAPPAAPQAA